MFGGKVEIRKDSENMVVMIGVEDGRLLKLKGTSAMQKMLHTSLITVKVQCPSSLLWHTRFVHINYDSLHLLRNNGVSGFPTIPRKLKQCDVCILRMHNKQPFHDSIP
jgi:hypothetical protein